jgi:predicted Zn-dependent protease
MGADLASLSNSRSFENEADETGWDYLVNARIKPSGLITFFKTIKKVNETELESTVKESIDLSFLSTHPDMQNRIHNLKQKEKKLNQEFTPLPNNFNAFKAAILKIK